MLYAGDTAIICNATTAPTLISHGHLKATDLLVMAGFGFLFIRLTTPFDLFVANPCYFSYVSEHLFTRIPGLYIVKCEGRGEWS